MPNDDAKSDQIRDIKLEFLRHGPAHNQLLSPLTPYMALCGSDGPVSVNLPFEHVQLITRLKRLRYEIDGVAVAPSQRQAELRELGDAIGRTLGQIPALVGELRAARADTSRLVNIQLKVSAYELGLVPFEATMAPADSSGSGTPLLLGTLTSMTREIRRGEPLALDWDREPKILFAFASPDGLPPVPAQAHLEALRRAIAPWIPITDKADDRLPKVREMLTVLPKASAKSLKDMCQAFDFTHVHLLAHGAPIPHSDDRRFGVVLHADGGGPQVVVDGKNLALALRSLNSSGRARQPPTIVSLATCDSGNAEAVLTPGGSIAHELHAQDIPWVIASQFPLWMRASNLAVELLYRGLLRGDDPRWVLHELRQRLCLQMPDTHDWASIVAYAAIAPDLEKQVGRFRTRQTKKKMNIKFERMDELVGANQPDPAKRKPREAATVVAELKRLCSDIRVDLAAWEQEVDARREPAEKTERLGMRAASEKRIAVIYQLYPLADPGGATSLAAYRAALDLYRQALKVQPTNHWVGTQFLSLAAIPALAANDGALTALAEQYADSWRVTRHLAEWQLASSDPLDQLWACGTLAELEMLGVIYNKAGSSDAAQRVRKYCGRMQELKEILPFALQSTRRQFQRYLDVWSRPQVWDETANAALESLGTDTSR